MLSFIELHLFCFCYLFIEFSAYHFHQTFILYLTIRINFFVYDFSFFNESIYHFLFYSNI